MGRRNSGAALPLCCPSLSSEPSSAATGPGGIGGTFFLLASRSLSGSRRSCFRAVVASLFCISSTTARCGRAASSCGREASLALTSIWVGCECHKHVAEIRARGVKRRRKLTTAATGTSSPEMEKYETATAERKKKATRINNRLLLRGGERVKQVQVKTKASKSVARKQ